MNVSPASMPFAPSTDEQSPAAELVLAMSQGRMSQLDLMAHAQHLESQDELRAAANLYALWINHARAPDKHFALFNYAGMLQGLNKPTEAMEAYEACISLKASFPQPYINLGLLFEKQGQDTNALEVWLRLISRRYLDEPPSGEFLTMALNHIGRVQEKLKHYAQAEQALEESLSISPSQPGVIQHWVHIRQKACQWPVYKPLPGVSLAEMKRYTSPLAMLAMTEEPAEQLLNSQSFVARTYGLREEHLCAGRQYQHERLRVAYVSGDFREHAVGFLLPSLLDGHGPAYELFAYDFSAEEKTPLRNHLKKQFDHFKSIHELTDRQAAELILSDEIDVLIDLHGLSSGARPGIFALRPAPRQGTYLGFMGPTGMPWIDFVVADRHVLPEELSVHFTEKPLYVEGSFLPLVSYADSAPVLTRAEMGLPETAFVMASFGNTYKITPDMFETWLRLLQRLPDAVLWLVDDNEAGTQSLRDFAIARGIDLARIVFSPRTAHTEFCARLKLADLFLDTYPYNCGSTSNDVLHAGLPLVSLYGKTLVSRMGLSLLQSLNMGSNATRNYVEYEDKVVELSIKLRAGKWSPVMPQGTPLKMALALDALRLASPAVFEPTAKPDTSSALIKVFQICYNEATRDQMPEGFELLDNLANERPDWREFWPIRQYLMSHDLDDDVFYGFFSPRFAYKTGLDYQKISEFARLHGKENDVLIFSPFWDLNSLFLNPFEQGEFFHPGLLACTQLLVDSMGPATSKNRVVDWVMHGDNTIFCNYFIAKKSFWLRWLEMGEHLFKSAESSGTALSLMLNSSTFYGKELLPQKIFVQERMANILMATGQFKSKSWGVFDFSSSITPLNQYRSEAIMANALKLAWSQTLDPHYMDQFEKIKNEVFYASGIIDLFNKRNEGHGIDLK